MRIMRRIISLFHWLSGDAVLDVACYIFTVSIGLSILFNMNASSGGLDIVAKILNRYLHMDLGKAMSVKKNTAAAIISVAIVITNNSRIVFFIFYGLLPFLYFHYNMGGTREKEEWNLWKIIRQRIPRQESAKPNSPA